MTISNVITTFIAFGGLRIIEEGGKYLVRRAKDVIGAKKFDKMVNIAKEAVNVTCSTIKRVGATATVENIREDVINKIALKAGLPAKEIEQYADEAMEVMKDIVNDVVAEDKNVPAEPASTENLNADQAKVQGQNASPNTVSAAQ